MKPRRRVAVLVSGRGSNLGALIAAAGAADYPAEIALVLSNVPEAGGLVLARDHGIATEVIDHRPFGRDRAAHEAAIDARLHEARIGFVCLAGYMRRLTPLLVDRWAGRMINIHPSLLPSFPGLDTHARALAAGNATITGELAGLGRSLLLLILGAGAFFVAIVVLADVLIRRRDLGRRRTLGIGRADLVLLVAVRTAAPAVLGAVVGAGTGYAVVVGQGGALGQACRSGELAVVPDVASDPLLRRQLPAWLCDPAPPAAYWLLPLLHRDQVFALLYADAAEPGTLLMDPGSRELLRRLGGQLVQLFRLRQARPDKAA